MPGVRLRRDTRPDVRPAGYPRIAPIRTAAILFLMLLAAACEPAPERAADAPDTVRRGDIEYAARSALLASFPVRFRTTVTAYNRGARDVTLALADDCAVLVRIATRGGVTRWDEGGHADCADGPVPVTLAAGDSTSFETELTAQAILGDSLPDDVYVIVAYVRPAGEAPVVLQAGRANLVAPPGSR